jgi:hypothetical protein
MAAGGDVRQAYIDILGRAPDEGGLAHYSKPEFSIDKVREILAASPEATVNQLFLEQLGRPPEAAAANHYIQKLEQGKTPQRIAEELDRSTEGFNYDTANIESAYRSAFGREADDAGYQFYMGQEDKELKTSKQIADQIKGAASGVDKQALINNPKGFLEITTSALNATPFGGRYAVDDPYVFDPNLVAKAQAQGLQNVTAAGQPNISETAAGQLVQYVSPVTRQPVFSGYTDDGQFKVYAGNDVLQRDRVNQAIALAETSGALTKADADRLKQSIANSQAFAEATGTSTPEAEALYTLLADPKATVVLDRMGVQIGESANRQSAIDEAVARQMIVDEARDYTGQNLNPSTILQEEVTAKLRDPNYISTRGLDLSKVDALTLERINEKIGTDDYKRLIDAGAKVDISKIIDSSGRFLGDYPFTEANLSIDPTTGKKIETFVTEEDVLDNLLTELGIQTDKEIKNVYGEGLVKLPDGSTAGGSTPGGLTPGGGTKVPAVKGTTGDFRGLSFPQERPTTIGETPAMLGFQPYTLTQAGSGQAKTTEPQPVIPIPKDTTFDPTTGALLGAVVGSMMPTPAGGGVLQGVTDIVDAATGAIRPDYSGYNVDVSSVPIAHNTDSSYNRLPVRNITNAPNSSYYSHGGMATPLMKEGGMVPHFADGGVNQVAQGIDKIISAPSSRGLLIGALMTQLMNAQAKSQAANAYRGVDMSKVGVIPPRTTQVGPVRFAPYRQYASAPEIPLSVSSPINVGGLKASQSPMFSFDFAKPTSNLSFTNPLARPAPTTLPTPTTSPTKMADGGAAYYTYGQHVDPMQYLQGMAQGGMAHGGLNEVHHADNAPLVQGRKDYRAGSAVTGPGDGQSDDIPAMLADGEYVFDSDTVAQLGNGSTKAGSKILDKFREEIRQHKRSAPVNKIPPPAKSPLAYLAEAQKKMKGARRG